MIKRNLGVKIGLNLKQQRGEDGERRNQKKKQKNGITARQTKPNCETKELKLRDFWDSSIGCVSLGLNRSTAIHSTEVWEWLLFSPEEREVKKLWQW